MILNIDDFSPEKIIHSGQCFRGRKEENGFRFITGEESIILEELENSRFRISCDEATWKRVWHPYFDLDRDYREICKRFKSENNAFIDRVLECGRGLRILRQDPWETLLTFILSQNKNMPAIRHSVELLCQTFGHALNDTIKSFPTPDELENATLEQLRACRVGYRDRYILDAAERVQSGRLNLKALDALTDTDLLESLKTVKGVGDKVAHCVALFAYGRTGAVPRDVWIKRSIAEDFGGEDVYIRFEQDAGILQQYVFYYKTFYDRFGGIHEDETVSAGAD